MEQRRRHAQIRRVDPYDPDVRSLARDVGADRTGRAARQYFSYATRRPERAHVSVLFGSVQKKCKIRVRNFHTLRHTFATRPLESGEDFKTLSELLGHENVEITMRIYAHTLLQTKRDAVQKLNDL